MPAIVSGSFWRKAEVNQRSTTADAEILPEDGSLRIPHGIICAEGIREHQDRSFAVTFENVMSVGCSRLKCGHRTFSPAQKIAESGPFSDKNKNVRGLGLRLR